MKKNTFLFAIIFMALSATHNLLAQNKYEDCANSGFYCGGSFGEFAINFSKAGLTNPKIKNLVVDQKNFYVFQSVEGLRPDDENSDKMVQLKQYRSFGLWKAGADVVTGFFVVTIDENGKVSTTDAEGRFPLGFHNGMPLEEIYDVEAVKKAFQAQLDNITARGAEGTEIMYAEIPQIGTTIALFIVYGSEIKANNGKPKWKLKVGDLVFDKQAVGNQRFKFIKSK